MSDVRHEKEILRKQLLSIRNEISRESGSDFSADICHNLMLLACYRLSDRRYFYKNIRSEVDVTEQIIRTVSKYKKCLLPKCRPHEQGNMDFFEVDDLSLLEKGAFGVLEPSDECKIDPIPFGKPNDIIIIPAIAFDRKGNRLGYGKGYYDRYLRSFKGKKIGVCFFELLVDSLPSNFYDEKVDFIVTEKGVFNVNG